MDAATILKIKPALTEYLHEFDGGMGRVTNRGHLATYVTGQLSDLDRKSIEPMADAAGVPPRTLQEFLGLLKWDESAARDRLQQRVARRHGPTSSSPRHPHSVGIIDETTCVKKGDRTACVQKQYCSAVASWRTAWPRFTWVMRPATFTRCWMASCLCRRIGITIGRGAARPAFRTTLCIAPSGASHWIS